jgi:hypothetical protein
MNAFLFIAIGLVGMAAHFLKRVLKAQTNVTFYEYMAINRKSTLAACVGTIVAIVTLLSAGQVELNVQTGALAFLAGYGADSAVNSEL